MKDMFFFTIILYFTIITSSFSNLNETNTIELQGNTRCLRFQRCLFSDKFNELFGKASIFDKSEIYQDFNVEKCDNKNSASSKRDNIFKGLLVHENLPDAHWHAYKEVHKKEYPSSHHEMSALAKWRENLNKIAEFNRRYLAGDISYSLQLNHLADLSATDYFSKILKLFNTLPLFDPAEDIHKTTYRKIIKKQVPDKVDWRNEGFKPRREEQLDCGACYAFAVTHALQAQLYKKHRTWGELSPQQIVDCSRADGNLGCHGGSLRAALRYVSRRGLIDEELYPYRGKRGHCRYSSGLVSVRPRRWATLPAGDEEAMERALASIGPLAVGVNAAPFTFQFYRSGVYEDPFCVSWQLNHAMLLVGYTQEYWVLLNWWGRSWGEDGYMRIRRGFNLCGVANMATYVEL